MRLTDITKRSEYDLSFFSEKQISELEGRIIARTTKRFY